jgi:glutamate synthase (NADPH/NADH) large chain
MSGGVAYVFDEDGGFARRCNTSMVALEPLLPDTEQAGEAAGRHEGVADEVLLRRLIEDHHKWTGSLRAREILDHWADSRERFVKVFPHEYKRALAERAAAPPPAAAAAAKPSVDASVRETAAARA